MTLNSVGMDMKNNWDEVENKTTIERVDT